MKRVVNGQEIDLNTVTSAEVRAFGDRLTVTTPSGTHTALAAKQGEKVLVSYLGRQYAVENAGRSRSGRAAHSGEIHAPMPGLITVVDVAVGQAVKTGDRLLVLEAMKTQQPFLAPFDGVVRSVEVVALQQVQEGQLLVRIVLS